MTARLPDIRAPNLPLAERNYNAGQQNQFARALRLYFNTIDYNMNKLVITNGGQWLSFPHIAASDNTDQYATANNTPTKVRWDTAESISGFVLNPTYSASARVTGTYKIDYSLQFVNTSNAQQNATVWLRLDGVDVPRSATKFTIPARKSVGNPAYIAAYSSIVFNMNAGQYLELYWATDLAFQISPATDGVYMEYEAAQTSPYAHPSIPSAVGSITFVSSQPI